VTRLRTLLRDAWVIARPYWFSDDRWAGRGLILVVVALTLGLVYINVLRNRWNNTFYNALQDRNYTVSYLNVITVQTIALADEVTAIQIRGRRIAAAVLLIQAVGGGWTAANLPSSADVTKRQVPAPRAP
jgi:ABC-type uncharacterized transport system fused permease/ATPase subunit